MKALTEPLRELAEFEDIYKKRKENPGMIRISGCVTYRVIACSSESKARALYEEYKMLSEDVYLYPSKDFLFYQADIRSKELVKQRMEVLEAVIQKEQVTVVTSFDAFMDVLLPKETIRERVIHIKNTDTLDLKELEDRLVKIGYDREVQIEGPGQFAVRGGIIDIYPLTENLPVRIELWGDEVDSVRSFDVETQRSIENLTEVFIYPAVEYPTDEEKGVSFLDYFEKEKTILFLDEPVRLLEKGEGVEEEFVEAQKRRVENGCEVSDEEMRMYTVEELKKKDKWICICRIYGIGNACTGAGTPGILPVTDKERQSI